MTAVSFKRPLIYLQQSRHQQMEDKFIEDQSLQLTMIITCGCNLEVETQKNYNLRLFLSKKQVLWNKR